jgi:hypothetical protein
MDQQLLLHLNKSFENICTVINCICMKDTSSYMAVVGAAIGSGKVTNVWSRKQFLSPPMTEWRNFVSVKHLMKARHQIYEY